MTRWSLREIGLWKSFVEGQHDRCDVSTANGPFVVLLSQDGANQAAHGRPVREDAHHIGASPDLLVETLLWVVGPDLLPVGGMQVSDVRRLKQLEEENRKLKQLLAEATLDNQALREILAKNW